MSLNDASTLARVPLPRGGILPNETGSNLWFNSGWLSGEYINLCGLWVANPYALFEWGQIHQVSGRLLVCGFLIETLRRLGIDSQNPVDFARHFRGIADEIVYETDTDIFSVSFDSDLTREIRVYPIMNVPADILTPENTSGEWYVESESLDIPEWIKSSGFSNSSDLLVKNFWSFAASGYIEVSGRFPHATSERQVIDPDIFLAGGVLHTNSNQIVIGDSPIWGTTIRISPELALPTMMHKESEQLESGNSTRKTISLETLSSWLEEFKISYGRKATRDEAVLGLNENYTSGSIRAAYAKQPEHLKRVVGERL